MAMTGVGARILTKPCDNPAGWTTAYYQVVDDTGNVTDVPIWHWAEERYALQFAEHVMNGAEYQTAADRVKESE